METLKFMQIALDFNELRGINMKPKSYLNPKNIN